LTRATIIEQMACVPLSGQYLATRSAEPRGGPQTRLDVPPRPKSRRHPTEMPTSASGHSGSGRAGSKSDQVHSAAESGGRASGPSQPPSWPNLDEFYATPSSEQKARFDTLQQLASP